MENHQENRAKRRDKDPRESDDGARSPRNNVPAERKEHVCPVCHRRFISGKALGGHVSAHVQARKARNKSSLEEEDGEEIHEDDDEINACFICEKQFPSKKSLYGHMRSHPDRAWRGMGRPPPQPPVIQEEEESEEQPANETVVDLQSRLKHWGTTDKRGRIKQMYNVAPLRHLLDAVDKEDRSMRRGKFGSKKINGDFASSRSLMMGKGKGKSRVSENPRFGRVERSSSCSSEDTDEYYCKNHVEEIRIHGGILNPKEIPKKNKESLEPPKPESKNTSKKMQHKVKTEIHNAVHHNDDHRRVESTPEIATAARARKLLRIDLNEMPDTGNGCNGGT